VQVAENIRFYILNIVDRLRRHPDLQIVPSTRASVALLTAARALAFIQQRDFVIPDDVKRLLVPVLSHRIFINPEAEIDNVSTESIINEIASDVAIPKDGVSNDYHSPQNSSKDDTENPSDPEYRPEEPPVNSTAALPDVYDKAIITNEESRCEPEGELINIDMPKAATGSGEITVTSRWDFLKIIPEWKWLLILSSIAIGTLMISIGIFSFG